VPNSEQNTNNLSTNAIPSGAISAAEIIKRASDSYGINPKVLLVLIQKESIGPLLTDTWPLPNQYKSVVGYACPDTAPCDAKYAGFYNQIMNAAYQFKYYKDHAHDKNQYGNYIYRHQPYNTVDLRYNPNVSCGSTPTRMDNYATSGLYNYTPYQPNQAALNNMYGTGDNCSAYGNRNFWRLFNDWFGTVRGTFQDLQQPRWMQLKSATRKIDPSTGKDSGDLLSAGQQIKFTTKIEMANGACLRTQHDTVNNNRLCIPISLLDELSITYSPLDANEELMMLKTQAYKQNLRTNKQDIRFVLQKNQQVSIGTKTTIGGKTYYITEHDDLNNIESGIPADQLQESASYEPITPVWYKLSQDIQKVNPLQQQNIESVLPANTIRKFTSRTLVNGQWYYRTDNDTIHNLDKSLLQSALVEPFEAFQNPRWMKAIKTTKKVNPLTGEISTETIESGSILHYTTKIDTESGAVLFRTEDDTNSNSPLAVPSGSLVDIDFENFKEPRWMTLNEDAQRISPYTGQVLSTITKDTQLKFTSKIEVNGVTYFRSEADANAGTIAGIDSASISEIQYTPLLQPRELRLKSNTHKKVPSNGADVDSLLPEGMIRKYVSKIEVNGQFYYRTDNDTTHNLNKAINAILLEEM
jgi:hypothetical protein